MSYIEYEDLFFKCQETAKYHMFLYDVVNSKKELDNNSRNKILELLFNVYERIHQIEIKENKLILHMSDDLVQTKLEKFEKDGHKYNRIVYLDKLKRADMQEPFAFNGDMFGFTILRNTLSTIEIDNIFEEEKSKLQITQKFHKASGFYETDKYEEGNKFYFRGYCMMKLERKSKIQDKDEMER